jgi:hypothetical protein
MKLRTFSVLLLNALIFAQNITWQRIYDRGVNINDVGYGICKSDGDNFFAVCTSNDSIYVIKIDLYGDTIFTRIINSGQGLAIASDSNGGCVITGKRHLSFTSKIDNLGNLVWFREYNNVIARNIHCYEIIMAENREYLSCGFVEGYTNYYGYSFKVDSVGTLCETYVINDSTKYKSLIHKNVGFTLVGSRNNSGNVMRIDSTSYTWNRIIKINGLTTLFNSIENAESLYFLAAQTFQLSRYEVYIIKLDMLGDTIFVKQISYDLSEYAPKIKRISPNKYILLSNKDTLDHSPGFAIIRLIDSTGNIIKERHYKWTNTLELFSMVQANDRGFLFVGWNKNTYGSKTNIYILKTDSLLEASPPFGINTEYTYIPTDFYLNQNYPNPFNPSTTIGFDIQSRSHVVLNIYDAAGRLVSNILTGDMEPGKYTADFNASNFASGVYYYELMAYSETNGMFKDVKKMVVLK